EPIIGSGVGLNAVRMPRADLAYVAGDQGVVLAFDGGTWFQLPSPSSVGPPPSLAEGPSLTSVTAFDHRHVYVARSDAPASYVWAWDGARWTLVMRVANSAGGIRAVGGTAPDDLWAVGKGNAWHLVLP